MGDRRHNNAGGYKRRREEEAPFDSTKHLLAGLIQVGDPSEV